MQADALFAAPDPRIPSDSADDPPCFFDIRPRTRKKEVKMLRALLLRLFDNSSWRDLVAQERSRKEALVMSFNESSSDTMQDLRNALVSPAVPRAPNAPPSPLYAFMSWTSAATAEGEESEDDDEDNTSDVEEEYDLPESANKKKKRKNERRAQDAPPSGCSSSGTGGARNRSAAKLPVCPRRALRKSREGRRKERRRKQPRATPSPSSLAVPLKRGSGRPARLRRSEQ